MPVKSGQSEGTVEVTPSGIPVYFQSKPKRLYRINNKTWEPSVQDEESLGWLLASAQREASEDAGGWPEEDWREVPSVTTVLEVLDKPALPWWGMGIGCEGVAILFNMGIIRSVMSGDQPILTCPAVIKPKPGEKFRPRLDMSTWVVAGKDQLIDVLNVQQLTVNHTRDKAGERGQSVHDAFETWANGGGPPEPEMYPPTEQGYIIGLLAFLNDVPSAEPVASEVLVASSEYGFAGRYDVRIRTHEPHRVVFHHTPVKGNQYRVLQPGVGLSDLKTSKGVYPSHSRQLEAYEQASVESGYEPTDWRGVLHVSAEGRYKLVRSYATFEDFEVVLKLYHSNKRMEDAERAERKRTA